MKLFILLSGIGLTALFGADAGTATSGSDFAEFSSVVTDADATAKNAVGKFATWFIGLLPLIGLSVGIFGGMKYLRKHSNGQDENFAKELGYGGVGAVLGLIVAMLFISAIGSGLMGSSKEAFDVLNAFWRAIFEAEAGASVK